MAILADKATQVICQGITGRRSTFHTQPTPGTLVNIFGGIRRCDIIAEGVVAAAKEMAITVPLVVRLEGTNVELGKQVLAKSGLKIVPADNLADAARKITDEVKEAG